MEASLNMTPCASPFSLQTGEDDDVQDVQTSGTAPRPELRRRRHSHFIPRRRKSIVSSIMEGEEAVMLKVSLSKTTRPLPQMID